MKTAARKLGLSAALLFCAVPTALLVGSDAGAMGPRPRAGMTVVNNMSQAAPGRATRVGAGQTSAFGRVSPPAFHLAQASGHLLTQNIMPLIQSHPQSPLGTALTRSGVQAAPGAAALGNRAVGQHGVVPANIAASSLTQPTSVFASAGKPNVAALTATSPLVINAQPAAFNASPIGMSTTTTAYSTAGTPLLTPLTAGSARP